MGRNASEVLIFFTIYLLEYVMTVSIVLGTYNWKEALEMVLISASRQTVIPDEVVVADDGSREDTRQLIERMQAIMPYKLKHAWQEDIGYRLAMAVNRAFSMCTSDYVITIGGDCIMEEHFVEDHLRNAKRGYYLSGSRSKFTPMLNERVFANHDYVLHFWTPGLTRRLNALRLPWLTPFFYRYKQNGLDRGCNMSFWRDDIYAVNGYDGDMIGYGSEDTDFSARLRQMGVKKRFVKFSCIEYHIFHDETPSKHNEELRRHNIELRESNARNGVIRIKNGIDQF